MADAKYLVKRFHYSRRWPANIQFVMTAHEAGGLFGTKGNALASVVYSLPGTRWRFPVLELCRLVRRDDAKVPLSWLIARSLDALRKRGAHLLVSFADAQQGHHGGVYKASNWHYAGMREASMEGVIVGGVFVPGRTANQRWGTRSISKLAEMGIDATPKYDEGKHLYWMALTKQGRAWARELFPEVPAEMLP